MTKKKTDPNHPTYTAARTELDNILRELEEGEVDIDQLTTQVERASDLIRICREKLSAQEAKVKKIATDLATEEASNNEETPPPTPADDEIPF